MAGSEFSIREHPGGDGRPVAYGGIVIRGDGRVLLREPRGHYYGYVWTFPKGKPDPGESPKDAAARELREETGVVARVLTPVPGVFSSADSDTVFFLMALEQETGEVDPETERICWATPEEARAMLSQTTNEAGRTRDIEALEAALALWQKHRT